MTDDRKIASDMSSGSAMSRSALGRASGVLSRLLSSSSRIQATGRFLQRQLGAWPQLAGYVGFFVVSPNGVVIAADHDSPVGKALSGYRKEMYDQGETKRS